MLKSFFPLTALVFGLLLSARADADLLDTSFPAEQVLAVEAEVAFTKQRLYELNQLALPLCPRHADWLLPPGLMALPPESKVKSFQNQRQAMLAAFPQLADKDLLVLSERTTSVPLLQRGDRLRLQDEAPAAEKPPGLFGLSEWLERQRLKRHERFSQSPQEHFELRRDAAPPQGIELERVQGCGFTVAVVNSEKSFAYARWGQILISRPLLRRLSAEDQTLAMVYEVAHVLSGFTELNANVVSGGFIGAALGLGGGPVRISPEPSMMIAIDKLAMMLAEPYGLGPKDFKRFLQERETERTGLFANILSYPKLREPSAERLKALDDMAAARAAGFAWERSHYIDHELFERFVAALPGTRTRLKLQP